MTTSTACVEEDSGLASLKIFAWLTSSGSKQNVLLTDDAGISPESSAFQRKWLDTHRTKRRDDDKRGFTMRIPLQGMVLYLIIFGESTPNVQVRNRL